MALVDSASLSLTSFETMLLDYISVHLKKTSTLVNFCAAILILKMEKNAQNFRGIMFYYFKKDKNETKMQKKRFVQCLEKMLRLTKSVKSGLQSFLVLLTFWPNNSLLWVCLMHWKMFSSTPGLYSLEANSGR